MGIEQKFDTQSAPTPAVEKNLHDAAKKAAEMAGVEGGSQQTNPETAQLKKEERKAEDQKKAQGIFGRIMEKLGPQPLSKLNDPQKIAAMVKEDARSLGITAIKETAIGGFGMGGTYRGFLKKYELGGEGEQLLAEIETLAKQVGSMNNGPEREKMMKEYTDKRLTFSTSMYTAAEKRISELS